MISHPPVATAGFATLLCPTLLAAPSVAHHHEAPLVAVERAAQTSPCWQPCWLGHVHDKAATWGPASASPQSGSPPGLRATQRRAGHSQQRQRLRAPLRFARVPAGAALPGRSQQPASSRPEPPHRLRGAPAGEWRRSASRLPPPRQLRIAKRFCQCEVPEGSNMLY